MAIRKWTTEDEERFITERILPFGPKKIQEYQVLVERRVFDKEVDVGRVKEFLRNASRFTRPKLTLREGKIVNDPASKTPKAADL